MNELLGLHSQGRDLTLVNICLRGIIVFVVTLIMVRVADKRFLAKLSAFDVILGFLLASMMARAVNGSAAFLPTLGGGFVLVFLHRLLGAIAFHADWFGRLVKGDARVVIERGKIDQNTLARLHVSEKDLLEELRLNGNLESPAQVKRATLERNGKISVVPEEAAS
jgi:uncharacterized membrane protein YcaP (DUF421 family)